jgi:hypothetical protein
MNNNIKGFWFKYYVLIVLFILGSLTTYIVINFKDPLPSVATLLGVALTTIYFVQKQKLEEIKLFKELFTEFNARYECLNDKLADIKDEKINDSRSRDKILEDYFNLCSEEYLFYKEGRIHNAVWGSWCRGMKEHLSNDTIKKYWERAQKENSYYGLTTDVIETGAKINVDKKGHFL